jgi:hypothetical protein
MRTFILSVTALASLAAMPAFAHGNSHHGGHAGYGNVDTSCESDRRTSRNVGGFIGALGGASAGRALAAAAVRPEGVILGTVVGAIVGASVGNAAVDCSPRALYTQDSGRSYGVTNNGYVQQPVYQQQPQVRYYPQPQNYGQAQVYQPPVMQQPAYQPAPPAVYGYAGEDRRAYSYQAPVQQPVYQQPAYQPPVYQQPVQQSHQVVAGEDWYQPSSQSYYGQERRGPLVAAPPAYGRPDYVPGDSYVASQQQQTVVVTQTYQAGGPVYAPQYAPQGMPVVVAPQGAPCGYQICR